MSLLHIFILALVQGITEFLPVSSSGHLVLAHHLLEGGAADMCWEQNRAMDVAVHIGTLVAVMGYFRADIWAMLKGLLNWRSEGFKLGLLLVFASLPVIAGGLAVDKLQPSFVCLLSVMAWMTLLFGVVLWLADRFPAEKTVDKMGFAHSFLIGLAQVLALVPGTSRSGITMIAARFLGYTRTESARFSMLLSIIAIAGAGTLSTLDLVKSGDAALTQDAVIAAVFSCIAGWITIALLMKWLERASFKVFAAYRIVLGLALLGLIYSGLLA